MYLYQSTLIGLMSEGFCLHFGYVRIYSLQPVINAWIVQNCTELILIGYQK